MLGASLCLAFFGVFSHDGVQLSSVSLAVFARFFVPCLIGVFPWLFVTVRGRALDWGDLFGGPLYIPMIRAVSVIIAHYAFFTCVTHMALVDAVLLFNTAPLFIPVIERLVFKQRVAVRVRICLAVAFVGVACIMKPSDGLFDPYALLGLVSGAGLAISQICLLHGSRYYSMFANMFHLYAFSSILALLPLVFVYGRELTQTLVVSMFDETAFFIFLALALSSIGNQYMRTHALRCVEQAAVLAPYMYLSVVFSGILGWALWGQVPDRWSLIGMVLVLGQGIFLVMPSRSRAKGLS